MLYLKYLKSLLRHKWFVFLEALKLGIPWLGIVHDLSKFLPSEFIPYARNFYGEFDYDSQHEIPAGLKQFGLDIKTREDAERDYDEAWLHHQHRNKHHWQRWVRINDVDEPQIVPLRMPSRYRREMLADWRGAGRAYGNPDTKAWYLEGRDKRIMHPSTRAWIEERLGIISE